MDERLRQKFIRLTNDAPSCLHYVHQIFNLVHREPVVDWLLKHGIRGDDLTTWVREKHNGETFTAIAFIVGEVNRARAQPIKGKDMVWQKPKLVSP